MMNVYDYSENNIFLEWWYKLRFDYQIFTVKLN